MKNLLLISATSLILALQGCAGHPAFNDEGYLQYTKSIYEKIKNNPNYRRIPLDTDQQVDDFTTLEYKAYKKEISKEEFIRELERQYPGYSESIKWNADQLPE
ncbi:MAG: hypothetical protein GKR94_21670 [Gammaproteobacteria bacterium]|nr:hypothetical protein [Gammaproteobacteria bacterium]